MFKPVGFHILQFYDFPNPHKPNVLNSTLLDSCGSPFHFPGKPNYLKGILCTPYLVMYRSVNMELSAVGFGRSVSLFIIIGDHQCLPIFSSNSSGNLLSPVA
ncbi:hypothetical protein CRM22_004492 [Opisthorchis felineus]|uniref:Uncharacterized protein n=1 Tax=Opisthorchis felineus TaxID=147828 RepID=A0A4S2LVY4_OPIFE|nr:hypothetical protein CRM22_004492 [Opisthorchis felineus]